MRIEGMRLYRTRRWRRGDVVRLGSLRLTSPLRTLIDLAGIVDESVLEAAHDNLWRRRLVEPRGVLRRLAQAPEQSLPGAGALRRLASDRLALRPIESPLETTYFGLLRRALA